MNRSEEILTILQEECAEVIQAVSKIKRFGMYHNVEHLRTELADLQCMIDLIYEFDVIREYPIDISKRITEKREKLKKFSKIFDETAETA
jgi:NTP pyrophosphatase (non-canonical NTP hydrolase)